MRVPKSSLTAFGCTAILAGAAVLVGPTAIGVAGDTTAPTVQITAHWQVGGQIKHTTDPANGSCGTETDVPYTVAFDASDPSGIDDYNLWKPLNQGAQDFRGWWTEDLQPAQTFNDYLNDYAGGCGGDANWTGWGVTAYDGENNAKYVDVGTETRIRPRVMQEDGTFGGGLGGATISYSGTWQTNSCTCSSEGRQVSTSQLGATATITVPAEANGTGGRVGLVMAKGPGRGQADIYVDGVRETTVNTYAAKNKNRIIVWTNEDLWEAGAHIIKIRNLATAGHARIDLDAVLF